MLNPNPRSPLNRAVFALLGLMFIGGGLSTLKQGHLLVYHNWWGATVFGPFAILFGVLIPVWAIFKPDIFKA
jgi:hypothetical protein